MISLIKTPTVRHNSESDQAPKPPDEVMALARNVLEAGLSLGSVKDYPALERIVEASGFRFQQLPLSHWHHEKSTFDNPVSRRYPSDVQNRTNAHLNGKAPYKHTETGLIIHIAPLRDQTARYVRPEDKGLDWWLFGGADPGSGGDAGYTVVVPEQQGVEKPFILASDQVLRNLPRASDAPPPELQHLLNANIDPQSPFIGDLLDGVKVDSAPHVKPTFFTSFEKDKGPRAWMIQNSAPNPWDSTSADGTRWYGVGKQVYEVREQQDAQLDGVAQGKIGD
jgi:hypothetical protein